MTRTSLFLAFMFVGTACGGSDTEPKSPSTTSATAPDEKSEENIQMSPGSTAAPAKKEAAPAPTDPAKPADPTKPANPTSAPK